MTQAQLADARDKAKSGRDGAVRAVRGGWGHVLFPVESGEAGRPFDLDHVAITARERSNIPAAVYDKTSAKGDGIIKEVLDEFQKLTPDDVVWSRSRQLWRKRRASDPPDTRMVR